MSWEEIQVASGYYPDIERIREPISQGMWDKCSINVKAVKDELSVCDGIVLRGSANNDCHES